MRPDGAGVGPVGQPVAELGVEVGRRGERRGRAGTRSRRSRCCRSTSPLNSGSRGGASRIRVARVPANAAAATRRLARCRRSRPPGPTPASADYRARAGQDRPHPGQDVPGLPRRGSSTAPVNRENAARHHQHRQHPLPRLPASARPGPGAREPQVALGDLPGLVHHPVARVGPHVLRPNPRNRSFSTVNDRSQPIRSRDHRSPASAATPPTPTGSAARTRPPPSPAAPAGTSAAGDANALRDRVREIPSRRAIAA